MIGDRDLFAEAGFPEGVSDVVAQALKRGHNGRGSNVRVPLGEDYVMEIDEFDRETIDFTVSTAPADQAVQEIGNKIMNKARVTRNPAPGT